MALFSELPVHFALLLLFLFLELHNLLIGVSSATLSISSDREALISFKSELSNDTLNPLSSWNHNSSPCNWTGVLCDKHGQRVTGLDLSGLGLSGHLSPYIGNLSLFFVSLLLFIVHTSIYFTVYSTCLHNLFLSSPLLSGSKMMAKVYFWSKSIV